MRDSINEALTELEPNIMNPEPHDITDIATALQAEQDRLTTEMGPMYRRWNRLGTLRDKYPDVPVFQECLENQVELIGVATRQTEMLAYAIALTPVVIAKEKANRERAAAWQHDPQS